MQVVILSSPGRETMLKSLLTELKGYEVEVINDPKTFGKRNFWKRYNQVIDICLKSRFDTYLILPDDVKNLDLKTIERIASRHSKERFTCNVINDGRTSCWGGRKFRPEIKRQGEYEFIEVNFFDCGGITNRETLQALTPLIAFSDKWHRVRTSSGVGFQITKQLRILKAKMYTSSPSLCYHGDHDSVMHPEERKKNPLISHPRMKKIVAIATMEGREKFLLNTIQSLAGQVDEIRIYKNHKEEIDYTDNAKFFFLKDYKEPVYYFTCDDDIIYPSTYIQDMIEGIEKHKCIVTHHGRLLSKANVSYYRGGHKCYRCTGLVNRSEFISVAGTGVTGFRTDYFNPTELYKAEHQKMSDIVFSLEAAKQDKKIRVLTHQKGYIVAQPVPTKDTIFGQHRANDSIQSALANEILKIQQSKPN